MKRAMIVLLVMLSVPSVLGAIATYGGNGTYAAIPASMPLYVEWVADQSGSNVRLPSRAQVTYSQSVGECGAMCLAKSNACVSAGNSDEFCRSAYKGCRRTCETFGRTLCDESCRSDYGSCIKVAPASQDECFNRFGICQQQCHPQVERPAPINFATCESQCQQTYQGCLNAGGNVMLCSEQVYYPCFKKCPQTVRVQSATSVQQGGYMINPSGTCHQTCGASCGSGYEACVRNGGSNCENQLLSCVRACLPVVKSSIITARVVDESPSIGEKFWNWLFKG